MMAHLQEMSDQTNARRVPGGYFRYSQPTRNVRLSFQARPQETSHHNSQDALDSPSSFQWQLPTDDLSAQTSSKISSRRVVHDLSRHSKPGKDTRTILTALAWPLAAIAIPIILLCVALLTLVFYYRVDPPANSSMGPVSTQGDTYHSLILVDLSSTRLLFPATGLSTVAPLLATFVMVLQSLPAAEAILKASKERQPSHLPTPYQLSLLVGLLLGSAEQLRGYWRYVFLRDRQAIPPALHRAGRILSLSFAMAGAVIIAATALQYSTQTISFTKTSVFDGTYRDFGRGIVDRCLTYNRSSPDNAGYPCSLSPDYTSADQLREQASNNEQFLLQHNASSVSELRAVSTTENGNGALTIILPQTKNIPTELAYRASTIGVATQCSLITTICGMHRIGDIETQFNCSKNFYGVVGKPPNLTVTDDGYKPLDPDVPGLCWKPALNLEFGFFEDNKLETPYNSVGWNPINGWPDPSLAPLTDEELINPIYLGIAGSFPSSSQTVGSALGDDKGIFNHQNEARVLDFVLSCPFTTYEVEYTWYNGTVSDISSSATPNGSIAEIYHGALQYYAETEGDYDIQDDIFQAALQENGTEFARVFGDLYSIKVLSHIGAFNSPRENIQEERKDNILVAKVSIPALGALVGCSLAYVLLAMALGVAGFRSLTIESQDLAGRLSLAGLTEAAFDPAKREEFTHGLSESSSETFHDKLKRSETRRVGIDDNPGADLFRVWF